MEIKDIQTVVRNDLDPKESDSQIDFVLGCSKCPARYKVETTATQRREGRARVYARRLIRAVQRHEMSCRGEVVQGADPEGQ